MSIIQDQEVGLAIKRVLTGNEHEYELIFEAHDRALRAFIGARYGHFGQDFVDEVAARTHLFASENLHKHKPNAASFQTWLNLRSLNFADQVRSEWLGLHRVRDGTGKRNVVPRTVPFDEERHEAWAPSAPGPEKLHEDRERSRLLWQSFKALPEESRTAIGLHDVMKLTFAGTASLMGLSVPKVRRIRERGLAVLKRRLQELGVRPVETDSTPQPIWYGRDSTGYDDDWTATVTAVLPDGPDVLVGAEAKDGEEEVPDY